MTSVSSSTSFTGRYESMFEGLNSKQQGAFVPFVMLGDPDLDTCFEIIQTLIDNGADALELGIPYSDPIADGPTIQKAAIRALDSGVRPSDCFALIEKVRQANPEVPIGLLLYSNLVLAKGIDAFYAESKSVGVDSILIADVPLREADLFIATAEKHGIQQILIAPPNASEETIAQIGQKSSGYTYLLGRSGVTGVETAVELPASDLVTKLAQYKVAPPLIGFGISKPKQVNDAIQAGAAGAISGSATVNIIAENLGNIDVLKQSLATFVSDMKAATQK